MKVLIQSSYAMERAGIVGLTGKVWPDGQVLDAEDMAGLQAFDRWDDGVDLLIVDWRNTAAAEELMEHFLGGSFDWTLEARRGGAEDHRNGGAHKRRPVAVAFCHQPDAALARRIVSLGAKAVVPLTDPPSVVAALLPFVMAGGTYLPITLLNQIATGAPIRAAREGIGGGGIAVDDPRFKVLTRRQREVLRLINRGLSNEEIAEEIGVTLNTVKSHVSSMLKALGVKRRTQAMRMLAAPDERAGR